MSICCYVYRKLHSCSYNDVDNIVYGDSYFMYHMSASQTLAQVPLSHAGTVNTLLHRTSLLDRCIIVVACMQSEEYTMILWTPNLMSIKNGPDSTVFGEHSSQVATGALLSNTRWLY